MKKNIEKIRKHVRKEFKKLVRAIFTYLIIATLIPFINCAFFEFTLNYDAFLIGI